ncbi:MAG: beta-hydroxyacyl-ACP dehydratase [Tannerella sp.]|jgi:3-hydroxyacyl-[acyl-carrier-protein] dehydratase|nr:beta-hydroxyacyl-ACP dehydratase [Tannerella sp.]
MLSDYYTVNSRWTEGDTTVFEVSLNPVSAVYRGHFPDMPVAPGVCNIQMIKECVERLTGRRLMIRYLAQCRLTTLLNPQQHPDLQVHIQLLENSDTLVRAQTAIGQQEETYFTLRFDASVQPPITEQNDCTVPFF